MKLEQSLKEGNHSLSFKKIDLAKTYYLYHGVWHTLFILICTLYFVTPQKIPLVPMGVLAPRLRTLDGVAQPPTVPQLRTSRTTFQNAPSPPPFVHSST